MFSPISVPKWATVIIEGDSEMIHCSYRQGIAQTTLQGLGTLSDSGLHARSQIVHFGRSRFVRSLSTLGSGSNTKHFIVGARPLS